LEKNTMQPGPSYILIIRHGEKVGDPKKDDDGGNDLSIQGSARAVALPSLFVPAQSQLDCEFDFDPPSFACSYEKIPLAGRPPRFPTPNFIFATQQSKNSKRPIETAAPTAIALGLPLNDGYKDKDNDIQKMTHAILTEFAFAGKVVLICWHHGKIPDVAKALGISNPPKWDGKVFDRVWQITFPKGKAKLDDFPQRLLFGDSQK
jgi:hypothetical protein